jgi:hypoxanthine phosphoribosyltransferase
MNKLYYSNAHVQSLVQTMLRDMYAQNWRPDYVVGITRGGLVPAVMISQYLGVPMHTLKVSLRDGDGDSESNLWMAEEAFGYVPHDQRDESGTETDPARRKKILIVDDINDTGATIDWIRQDWVSGCLPNSPVWDSIWNDTTKFAVLVNNEASGFKNIDYAGTSINKHESPCWVVFPWEDWWQR